MVEAPWGRRARSIILKVDNGSASYAGEIQPAMLVKVLILGGEKGIDHKFGNRLDRDIQPSFARIFRHQRAVRRMNPRHHRRFVVL